MAAVQRDRRALSGADQKGASWRERKRCGSCSTKAVARQSSGSTRRQAQGEQNHDGHQSPMREILKFIAEKL